jgi:murein DD-endopeptidase MepM/ murein hydrolase activator NlpD
MAFKRWGLVLSVWFCLLLAFSSTPALVEAQVAPVAVQASDPTASQPPPTTADPDKVYFPETGHYLSPTFRIYWQRYGGLAQFGLPLTEEFQEQNPADGKTYTVQYFERNRFEYHPEFKGTFYEVLLGLLGRQSTTGRAFPDAPAFTSTPQRFYFPETHHSLSNGFRAYWEKYGGLPIYGYPISEEFTEGGFTVQYFERARFEYHPENRGTPYEVQLGLLGTNALTATGRQLPQTFRVQPEPGSVVQGHALQVTISAAGGQFLGSSLAGVKLNFLSQGDKLVAVTGIVSDAPLKPRLLITEIKDSSGVIRRFEQNIGVLAGQFEHQLVELDPTVEAGLGTEEEQAQERARDFSFYNQVTPEKLWTGRFSWPLELKGVITTPFGSRRDYVGGGYEIHDALDIAVPAGTPILAPQRGRVVLAEFQKVRGGIVILDHGLGLHTAYFHQSRIVAKVGDMLEAGDLIGYVGTTGLSTGPHLHWEMRIGSTGIDPQEWLGRSFIASAEANLLNIAARRLYRY